ncbi:PACE efflux transporter [Paraburkholderia silvatlantica]|uniref:Putative membrane protein n=1 Tax=Paraburkholderia silvatlantica TaxID=321895 RepID=A0A2V4T7V0_9BURK|nr:PACE efflux transporter [Paraburkholderia silvatlantica]PYE21639.1 putative membrane protein [Paraburkholderia silvatlantica]TDQ86762.1 putative membrane protein [Paraburkholderia silvatlantica]
MQGIKRRIVYVTLFEGIAILITGTSFASLSGSGMDRAGAAAVFSSLIAVGWNFVFNLLFERWEARQTKRGRSVARRIAHAVGFEGGLVVLLVPMIALTLHASLIEAFAMDIGLSVFFLVYNYVYNLIFDAVFGLPASAMPVTSASETQPRA